MAEKEKEKRRSSSDISQLEEMRTNKGFPKCIFFILGNEFCERYSYYGMRTILVLYLKYYLHWDDDTATAVYHAFTVLAYLFPILGALIADTWWGKYKTILWLSVVYAIGMVLNTLGSIGDLGDLTVHAILSSAGLLVIAIGTGGIKPCVSAFGGDQFEADQENYRRRFFSLFYFAINAGSLVSTFVSPLIREEVECFGDDCYALAFGIPAILMVVAIVFFLVGTKSYKRVMPKDRIFLRASSCVGKAIKNRWNTPRKERNKDHWMDYAMDGTNAKLVRDIKYVLRVLILYIPLPLFWTLFDQQGSRWTLQAVRMDGYVGTLRVLPDQMQICNPLMIVTLIPLFEATLYPLLRKFNINFSPLRRMSLGMFLAGISFVVAALIQMKIDVNLTKIPETNGETSLRIINAANCPISFTSNVYPTWENAESGSTGNDIIPGDTSHTEEDFIKPGTFHITYWCQGEVNTFGPFEFSLGGKTAYDLVISSSDSSTGLKHFLGSHPTEKSENGRAAVGVVNTLGVPVNTPVEEDHMLKNKTIQNGTRAELPELNKGFYTLKVYVKDVLFTYEYEVKTGGLYTIVLSDQDLNTPGVEKADEVNAEIYMDIYYNDVNIFWMIPQYFVITLGEVFLSVTGLEFSYSQAPPSMKSILQALWLLTVSIGNIIVLIIAEARLVPNQADEYFLFAGLIGIAVILFVFLSMRYEYVDESAFADDDEEELYDEDEMGNSEDTPEVKVKAPLEGATNSAYDHDTGF